MSGSPGPAAGSIIQGVYHLQRGYGSLLPKLAALGAELEVMQR